MIYLSFMNLFRNMRRTLAILLTVAIGSGVLFSFQGFIHGVLVDYRESHVHAHDGHGQIHTKNYRESNYTDPWNHWIGQWNEVHAFLSSSASVEHIFPRVTFSALLKNGRVTINGAGQGINAAKEKDFFHGLNVEQGASLDHQEDGILLGNGLAKALHVQPGDVLNIMVNASDGTMVQSSLRVTGIFHTGSLDFDNRVFRIQLAKAQSLLKTTHIESIALGLKDYAEWDAFALAFENAFPQLEATSFAELDKVYYQHSVDWLNAQFYVIQSIILFIVLLGIFNSISSSILERKQEIGNFRANGESVQDVIKLITLEGTFLGILGACMGLGATYFIVMNFINHQILMPPGPGLTRSFYISFEFEWPMVLTTLGLSTVSAILASFLGGLRVATMPIAKALRAFS
jgi:putative ABC transport system permease protein